jgi:phosphatidylserine decarboxylase
MGARGTVAGRVIAAAVSWPSLSRMAGHVADLRLPRFFLAPAIRAYAHVYGVDLSEAEHPPEAYPTFNAFFTRRLRSGSRPTVARPGIVVAPCDARLTSIGPVGPDGRLEQVKGRSYAIESLLGSREEAAPFLGGLQATLYLSPAMYHRVHAPADGVVTAWRYVPGRLFPVNAAGVRSVPGLFTRNERVAVFIESAAHGPMALVLVGAANVGRITLAFTDLVTNAGSPAALVRPPAPIAVQRGDEVGVFNLGSTVVLLASDPGLAPAGAEAGSIVRVGEALWRKG